jgi:hypothetical protein
MGNKIIHSSLVVVTDHDGKVERGTETMQVAGMRAVHVLENRASAK